MKYFSIFFATALVLGLLAFYPSFISQNKVDNKDMSSTLTDANQNKVELSMIEKGVENPYIWSESQAAEYEDYISLSDQAALKDYKIALQKKSLQNLPFIKKRVGELTSVQSLSEIKPLTEEERKVFIEAITPEEIDSLACKGENQEWRNYLNEKYEGVSTDYFAERPLVSSSVKDSSKDYYSTQKVSQQCVTFVMKKFFEPAMKEPKKLFAYCEKAGGAPEIDLVEQQKMRDEISLLETELKQPGLFDADLLAEKQKKLAQLKADVDWRHRYYKMPCVTKDYINVTYNSFQDVSECLNISQKELLPKFFNESGLHVNAYGAGRDAGVGQLTGPAIKVTKSVLSKYLEEMQKSDKASCQRILKVVSAIEDIDPSPRQRCNLMALPENPLRNLVYTGIFYKENVKLIAGIFYEAGVDKVRLANGEIKNLNYTNEDQLGGILGKKEAQDKLKKLGLKKVNMHEIKNMLVALAYNSGPETTVNKFVDYLDERLFAKSKEVTAKKNNWNLTAKDFDFASIDVRPVRKQIMPIHIKSALLENEKLENPDQMLLEELAKLRGLEKDRRSQLPKHYLSAYKLTLPEFLTLRTNAGPQTEGSQRTPYQLFGYPGYLSALATKNTILNIYFPNNECTNPNYLKLSE